MYSYTYGMPITAQNKIHSPNYRQEALNEMGNCPWRSAERRLPSGSLFFKLFIQVKYSSNIRTEFLFPINQKE